MKEMKGMKKNLSTIFFDAGKEQILKYYLTRHEINLHFIIYYLLPAHLAIKFKIKNYSN